MKKRSIQTGIATFVLVIALTLFAHPWSAQADYPEKPVTFMVGFAAGGSSDLLARIISQGMTKQLGQQIIVENKPGASGIIAATAISKATADGYTLMISNDTCLTVAPSLFKSLQYDPGKDFTYVSMVADHNNVLIVNTATGINTLNEFIDKAKSAPGAMTYASPGLGTPPHLAAELFCLETGLKMKHIPYKGGGAALTDVLGGQVNSLFVGLSVASSNLTSGKIKPLVATGIHRSSELPDVPTFGELGLAKVDFNPWFALIGPAKIDPMIVEKLRQALHATLKSPETIALLKAQGYNPRLDSQDQFASIIQKDTAQWTRVVKESGITLE